MAASIPKSRIHLSMFLRSFCCSATGYLKCNFALNSKEYIRTFVTVLLHHRVKQSGTEQSILCQ